MYYISQGSVISGRQYVFPVYIRICSLPVLQVPFTDREDMKMKFLNASEGIRKMRNAEIICFLSVLLNAVSNVIAMKTEETAGPWLQFPGVIAFILLLIYPLILRSGIRLVIEDVGHVHPDSRYFHKASRIISFVILFYLCTPVISSISGMEFQAALMNLLPRFFEMYVIYLVFMGMIALLDTAGHPRLVKKGNMTLIFLLFTYAFSNLALTWPVFSAQNHTGDMVNMAARLTACVLQMTGLAFCIWFLKESSEALG